ncbi:hypothetical protein OSTOST_24026, partial [Ostertagia ostertagi]
MSMEETEQLYDLLKKLSLESRPLSDRYWSVIWNFQRREKARLRSTPNPPTGRACFHCHCRLGLIFNAGTRCAQCGRLLCNTCRRGTYRSKVALPELLRT